MYKHKDRFNYNGIPRLYFTIKKRGDDPPKSTMFKDGSCEVFFRPKIKTKLQNIAESQTQINYTHKTKTNSKIFKYFFFPNHSIYLILRKNSQN